MSEFLSNFVTYSTASLFGGLCLLASPWPQSVEPETAALVAESRPIAVPEIAKPEPKVELAALTTEAPRSIIREAKLESVVFTAGGVDQRQRPIAASRRTGIVTGNSVNLRGGPGTSHSIVDRAVKGDALPVTGQRDGVWFEVISGNSGQPAWIHGSFFNAPPDENGAVLAQN